MPYAPQQNWSLYEASTQASDIAWLRALTSQERFSLYENLFDTIWAAKQNLGNWEQLDAWNWRQKVVLRLRMVDAYRKLDLIQS